MSSFMESWSGHRGWDCSCLCGFVYMVCAVHDLVLAHHHDDDVLYAEVPRACMYYCYCLAVR